MAGRRIHSIKVELIRKSREAALSAIQIYNNPLIQFKSETFIVLMIIAWTYLMHAYYRTKRIEYRYYEIKGGRRRYIRTKDGAYKHWELERCLDQEECPLDRDTKNNLRFLIRLRNEIEHRMAIDLDNYLSGRYQACAINYCHYIKKLFGEKYGLESYLTYSLQFVQFTPEQVEKADSDIYIPPRIRAFINAFDESLTAEEYDNPRFSYRLVFTRVNVNRPGQADRVIQFVDPNSEMAKNIEKTNWVQKYVEKPKFLPRQVVQQMREEGYSKFNMHHHTQFWKSLDAKNPKKGYGVQVANTWYWYEQWIDEVRKHCEKNAFRYR